eukprot:COSAG02_NODE_31762_length_527_cov_2.967290_1_plen_61_part_00
MYVIPVVSQHEFEHDRIRSLQYDLAAAMRPAGRLLDPLHEVLKCVSNFFSNFVRVSGSEF